VVQLALHDSSGPHQLQHPPHQDSLVKAPSQQGFIGRRRRKSERKKKYKTSGYETASFGFVADSFRFPDRAIPWRLRSSYETTGRYSLTSTSTVNPIVSSRHGSTPTQESKNQRHPPVQSMACYPGDCPIHPQNPGIPRTHASLLLAGCPLLMHCLDIECGKGVMRCHFVACTQQQLRLQLNPYHRSWPDPIIVRGIRQ
jgi:hypothetical protein